jgi:superfamily II DNA or RNA helicase
MDRITLTHPFKDIIPDIEEFFVAQNDTGVISTVNSLCHKISTLAEKYATQIDIDKFKGDALELFVEYFIKTNGSDNRVGIYDYHVASDSGFIDVGVDGYGDGENKKPATVQVKFRSGFYVLTAKEDRLDAFRLSSITKYGVDNDDDKNMLIITTAKKVNEFVMEQILDNKVRVLNRDALREMLDNRPEWWTRFYETVKENRTQKIVVPIKILRQHQKDCVAKILADSNNRGKIIMPPGTGKTLIAAEIILNEIRSKLSQGVTPLIKVNSPRILLCYQLFEEIFHYLNSYGIPARYMNYNSGSVDEKEFVTEIRQIGSAYRSIISTTSVSEVKRVWALAQKENIPLLVFSTYHSSEKFSTSGLIPDLTIHDEAHNLVSPEFHKAARLPSKGDLFFTATMKVTDSDKDLGMNNEEIFDNLIFSMSPVELIGKGEMVPPYMHIVKAKNINHVDVEKVEADYDALFNSIQDAFFFHERKIKEQSYAPQEIGAKVLVVCSGQQDLIEIFKTKVFANFRATYPDIHVFALCSEYGIYNDGEYNKTPVTNVKKLRFLRKIRSLKNNERCIIFHVDMIGEGIDVPGITGVMPFRNCELSKFVQNVGRSSRLNTKDRERFYAKEIGTDDRTKYIKPYSWVIVPAFLANSEGFVDRFIKIINRLKNEFGFIPTQNVHTDNVHGLSDDELIDTVNDVTKNRRHTNSGIVGFEHEFDDLTPLEKVLFDDKVEEKMKPMIKFVDSLFSPENLIENTSQVEKGL